MIITIAVHHPVPEHRDTFLGYMQRVVAAAEGAEGLLEFRSLADRATGRLLGFARWESEEAFQAALPRIGSLRDERRPEWTDLPDELLVLEDA